MTTKNVWAPTLDAFEKLFVNQPEMDKIRAYLGRFNPLKVLRSESQELKHSNILGWLLDPKETHGLGDQFLKAFLSEALRGRSDGLQPSSLDIVQSNLRDAEVRREWLNIDLFVISASNNWAFIIENKYKAKQTAGQLKTYFSKVEHATKSFGQAIWISGIFLTLNEEEPEDPRYKRIGYDAICELLSQTLSANRTAMGTEVQVFLDHYLEILKEATDMSEDYIEIQKVARTLYKANKKVLDFIWEHASSTDFLLARDTAFGNELDSWQEAAIGTQNYIHLWSSGNRFSFLPWSWYTALGEDELNWSGCENWWSGYPLICWMELAQKSSGGSTLRLFAEVGPLEPHRIRASIINAIEDACEGSKLVAFQQRSKEEGKKY